MSITDLPRVVIESPLRGSVPKWVPTWLAPVFERWGRMKNHRYALLCMRDSLRRGEAPYASHVLFDRRGLLDDALPDERMKGLNAGLAWGRTAPIRAVYCDRGISDGMRVGIATSPVGQIITYRFIFSPPHDPLTVERVQQLTKQAEFRKGIVS